MICIIVGQVITPVIVAARAKTSYNREIREEKQMIAPFVTAA